MFTVKNNKITMTRGDTGRIKITLYDDLSNEYTPSQGDIIRFAAKKNYSDSEPAIFIVIPNDTLVLEITPSDTESLDFGTYVYDLQITFEDGSVNTFVAKAILRIEEEVD